MIHGSYNIKFVTALHSRTIQANLNMPVCYGRQASLQRHTLSQSHFPFRHKIHHVFVSAGSCGCLLVCQLGHFSHWTTGSPHPKRIWDPHRLHWCQNASTPSHIYTEYQPTKRAVYTMMVVFVYMVWQEKQRQFKPLCLLLVKALSFSQAGGFSGPNQSICSLNRATQNIRTGN